MTLCHNELSSIVRRRQGTLDQILKFVIHQSRFCQTVKVMATEPYYIRATFPPLRHFSTFTSKRHHCIHRLINHVYTKGQSTFVIFRPTTWWQQWDKTLRSQEYKPWMCDPLPINWKHGKELTQGLPFHTPIAALPSCGTSVPVSRGHCITVSKVQQEDCDKGHIQYQVVCFRLQ